MKKSEVSKRAGHTYIVPLTVVASFGLLFGSIFQIKLLFIFSIFLYLLPLIFWAYTGWKDKIFVRRRYGVTQIVRGKAAAFLGALLTIVMVLVTLGLLAWVYLYLEENGF